MFTKLSYINKIAMNRVPVRAFRIALREEIRRVLRPLRHPALLDTILAIDRFGRARWELDVGDQDALHMVNAALELVNFSTVFEQCGVRTTWAILEAFEVHDDSLSSGVLLSLDCHGDVEELHMLIEDFQKFKMCCENMGHKRKSSEQLRGSKKRARVSPQLA